MLLPSFSSDVFNKYSILIYVIHGYRTYSNESIQIGFIAKLSKHKN